ncbi:MAG: (2Fe-2S)-binding protein [Planctomycetota bacterium]|nr:(2Fe-2S)-binding protein [Planctomycetota bacterium]
MITRVWTINGRRCEAAFSPEKRLLDVLRGTLRLTGTKEGCGEGECGACSVLVGGTLKLSCLVLAAALPDNTRILTIEGIGRTALGRRIQSAFVAKGAVQCGFCTPGMVVAAFALLSRNRAPNRQDVKTALAGNLCRCTGYQMIFEAVESLKTREPKIGKVKARTNRGNARW